MFVKEPDFRRTADHVVGHDAFDHNGLDPEDAAQVDADVSESLFLLDASSGGGIHPRFPEKISTRRLHGGSLPGISQEC